VDPVDLAVRDLEVSRPGSASADNDGVILDAKLLCIDVDAHVRIGDESLCKM
jgi:hypothetical protein